MPVGAKEPDKNDSCVVETSPVRTTAATSKPKSETGARKPAFGRVCEKQDSPQTLTVGASQPERNETGHTSEPEGDSHGDDDKADGARLRLKSAISLVRKASQV